MLTNRVLNAILTLLAPILAPLQLVTTLVLGLAVELTFGLLLLPITLVWVAFYMPLLGLSWICNRASVLRNVIGFVLIPWAVVAYAFVGLMPSMGELESRALKLMLCNSWPFTWELAQFSARKLDPDDPLASQVGEVMGRISKDDPLCQQVIMRVMAGEQLD